MEVCNWNSFMNGIKTNYLVCHLYHYNTIGEGKFSTSVGIVGDICISRIICYKRVELELDSSKCTKLKTK